MEGAADLHSQITREFSFIQELIWSPPHKNLFPLSSEKILSSLKTLDAWRRSSLTGRKSSGSLIMILDTDTRTLIDIRRHFCKLLSCIEPQRTDAHTIVKLEKAVDGIIVRHMEKAWKDLKIDLMKSEDQQATNIDHEALTDAVKQFLHEYSPQTEVGQEEGTSADTSAQSHPMHIYPATGDLSKDDNKMIKSSQEDRRSTLHIKQSAIGSDSYLSGTSDEESNRSITGFEEFQDEIDREARTNVLLSSSENDEYLSANSDEEINLPTAVIKGAQELHPFEDRVISQVFLHKKSVEKTDQSLLNGNSEGHNELKRSMPLAVKSTTTDEKVPEEKLPLQAKEELYVGDEQSGKNNPRCSGMSDVRDVLNRNIAITTIPTLLKPELSKIVTQARSEDSTVTVEDNEESDHTEQGVSINLMDHDDELEGGKDEAYESGVYLAIHHKPLTQDDKKFFQSELQRGMSSFDTDPVTDRSESSQDESEPDPLEKDSEALAPVATAKTERDRNNLKSQQLSKSVSLPVEVEMTMRAKLCALESEEPYWHVIFALQNESSYKIGVQRLSYWSLDSVDDITTVKWPPGKLILREQPSFLGYSINVPCRASYDSPRMAFSWHYSKITKWIPTGDSRSKAESTSIRKRLGNLLSLGDTNKKMKKDARDIITASNGGSPKLPKFVDN